MFIKDNVTFPIKNHAIFLNGCGVSPIYAPAVNAQIDFVKQFSQEGSLAVNELGRLLISFRENAAKLLNTLPENIAFVSSTAEAINMIANGYPFSAGDEIISYVHEYPSNYYPWANQKKTGIELKLLPNSNPTKVLCRNAAVCWSFADLERLVSKRTKIIALSHVQFNSGFAANLRQLSEFCKSRKIDLVIDAAQSLGCMPVYPDELGLSAVVSSGWKWLMGPIGSGIFYSSPEFRDKLRLSFVGHSSMCSGQDYLDHSWNLSSSASKFEYSTLAFAAVAGLSAAIAGALRQGGIGEIWKEVCRLQEKLLSLLPESANPLLFVPENRSGILSIFPKCSIDELANALQSRGIVVTARNGFLRLAPHYHITDAELESAADAICDELKKLIH